MTGYHKGVGCDTCHDGRAKAGAPSLRHSENPSIVCRECHKYENAGDHHPSYSTPGPFVGNVVIDQAFKLYDGGLECLTCHQMHKNGDYQTGTRKFLVGGPYQERRDICFRCHKKGSYHHANPHEKIKVRKKLKCLMCHYVSKGDNPKLRASVAFLCWRCHQAMPGEFLDRHFLVKPKIESVMNDMLVGIEPVQDNDLHLDSFNRMTCFTCHDPHLPNLKGEKEKGRFKVRLRSEKICGSCHKI